MAMDRSTRINPRAAAPNGLGGAGNSRGPASVAMGPVGTLAVRRGASTDMARPAGKAKNGVSGRGEATDNKLVRPIQAITFKQNLAGQTFNFAPYFSNARQGVAGTWAIASGPTGMTINSTTGVLSGTPTTVQSVNMSLTVISAKTPADANLVIVVPISVVA